VEAAARAIGSPRFLRIKEIVDHIERNASSYPFLTMQSEWHPVDTITTRAITCRVNNAIAEMKWQPWNNGRGQGTGRIFLLPWVGEDPAVTAARGGTPLFLVKIPGRAEP
jgi:hypothetical protein